MYVDEVSILGRRESFSLAGSRNVCETKTPPPETTASRRHKALDWNEASSTMAGAGAWQNSGRGDFESDPTQHDGQDFGAMPLQSEFAFVGSTPLYGHTYQSHGAFPRVDHMNPSSDAQGIYVGVPTYHPVMEFGVYGDAMASEAFAPERNTVLWESESNAGNASTNVRLET
jgi:hypothetical protein